MALRAPVERALQALAVRTGYTRAEARVLTLRELIGFFPKKEG